MQAVVSSAVADDFDGYQGRSQDPSQTHTWDPRHCGELACDWGAVPCKSVIIRSIGSPADFFPSSEMSCDGSMSTPLGSFPITLCRPSRLWGKWIASGRVIEQEVVAPPPTLPPPLAPSDSKSEVGSPTLNSLLLTRLSPRCARWTTWSTPSTRVCGLGLGHPTGLEDLY